MFLMIPIEEMEPKQMELILFSFFVDIIHFSGYLVGLPAS